MLLYGRDQRDQCDQPFVFDAVHVTLGYMSDIILGEGEVVGG